MTDLSALDVNDKAKAHRNFLFVACFVALVATAFAFLIRGFILPDLQTAFDLTETEKGQINGAGLWPFGISIVVFSLVIDRIGYGKAMIFAFVCHVASVFLMIFAKGYWSLYAGAGLCGLAAGTVEAVVNPVIASMFPKHKTKMLTILHGGWAGGVCLAGFITLMLSGDAVAEWVKGFGWALWQFKVGLLLIPTAAYGFMMLFCKFPVNERVVAGVPYKDMLKEAGALSILIVSFMIFKELGRVFVWPPAAIYGSVIACTLAMLFYTRSLGRPLYVFLLLIMILLAITELGTDAWIKDLMGPAMSKIKLDGGWVLVYTSFLMMLLRFGIGPFVKVLKPLGVLLMGSLFAAAGLFFLSSAQGAWMILIFATVYGIGQAFFWPVTIGLVAEQFPRGGALTLNAIAGVGMLAVGIIGQPMLGTLQDMQIDRQIQNKPVMQALANEEEKTSLFIAYRGFDNKKIAALEAEAQGVDVTAPVAEQAQTQLAEVKVVRADAKQKAMASAGVLPLIMAVCYIGLMIYFRKKGGYKAVDLTADGVVVGTHAVTPTEAIADAEATPSE